MNSLHYVEACSEFYFMEKYIADVAFVPTIFTIASYVIHIFDFQYGSDETEIAALHFV